MNTTDNTCHRSNPLRISAGEITAETIATHGAQRVADATGAAIVSCAHPLYGTIYGVMAKGQAEKHIPAQTINNPLVEVAEEWVLNPLPENSTPETEEERIWNSRMALIRVYVGIRYIGIALSWTPADGWRNCYSHGNCGKNWSHGGNWSADNKRTYATAAEALADRDYMVGGIKSARAAILEGAPEVQSAFRAIVGAEARARRAQNN